MLDMLGIFSIKKHPPLKQVSVLIDEDIADVEEILLGEDGNLRVVSFDEIRNFSQNKISLFCHRHGVYQIVTEELVDFVHEQIRTFGKTIEIGSGNGCLGRALGIPLTDNRMQERKDIATYYGRLNQPVVRYARDVRGLDAITAVTVLKADCAVGSWVTHKFKKGMADGNFEGVDDRALARKIKRYVFIGNEHTHRHKEMLRFCEPKVYKFDWLVSRSQNRAQNVIWVFDF